MTSSPMSIRWLWKAVTRSSWGLVNDAYAGVFLQPAADAAEVVVDLTTPVPDEPGQTFTDAFEPWLADGATGFVALSNTCQGVPQAEQIWGLYRIDGGMVARVADNCRTDLPGGQSGELFTDLIGNATPVHDAGAMAFWGHGTANTEGIFTDLGGTLRPVALLGESLPGGQPGEVFENWMAPFQSLASISGDRVAFLGRGDLGTVGVFVESSGSLELLRNLDDPPPGWQPGELLDLDLDPPAFAWLSPGGVTFYAAGEQGSKGIYVTDGVTISPIIAVGDPLDGQTVTDLFGLFHATGDRVSFAADLSDGRVAVFTADTPLFADGFESGDTTVWSNAVGLR